MAVNELNEPTPNESAENQSIQNVSAQREPIGGAPGVGEPVQDQPIQQGSTEASDESKIDGIVEQVRYDLGMGHADDARNVLQERLSQTGVAVESAQLDDLVRRVTGD